MNPNNIIHTGRIANISEEEIQVVLEEDAACADCHAKGACGFEDKEEKMVQVEKGQEAYSVGEKVEVFMSMSLGVKALMLAYVVPFFLLIIGLIVALSLTGELMAGIIALSIVALYYVALYYTRDKLKKTFTIHLKKL